MRRGLSVASTVLVAAGLVAVVLGAQDAPLRYRVAEVKGKLLRETPEGTERLAAGAELRPGEVLRTGWRSRAVIEVPERAATFVIGPRTRVRLTAEVPGGLLEMECGRLRAVFDRLTGAPPIERIVTTPTAILAVRGTEYGVRVGRSGTTAVNVFAGVVRVQDRQRRYAPVEVRAGYGTSVGRGQAPAAPEPHGLSAERWEQGGGSRGLRGGAAHQAPGGLGAAPPRGGVGGGSGRHGR